MGKVVPLVLLSLLAAALPAAAEDRPADAPPAKAAVTAKAAQPTKQPAAASEKTTQKTPVEPDAAAAEAARQAATHRVLARAAPRSMAEALRRLDAIRLDIDFNDMELTTAAEFVGRMAGFNVIVAPELQRDGGLDAMPHITMKLRQVSLRQVTELLTRFTGTQLALNGSILSFTTKSAARGEPVLRIYSIGELTMKLMSFPGPDMNLRPSGAEFEQEEPAEIEHAFSDPEKIVDMVRQFIESESWEDDGVSISADERKMVVKTYPAVQRKVARFLMLLRAAR